MLIKVNKQFASLSMPRGVIVLFFIQIMSTLSFSVLYSTLVLYMKGKLGLSSHLANSIMGVFIAFNFGLHLLGGFWGGRLLSNRSLFCVGMIAQLVGCLLLSIERLDFFYYGLAAFLTGSGLNVTCINCMVTQLFAPEDTKRETAFFWTYAGMNIGFFIGFSLSGLLQITQNYQRLFLLSSLGNFIALLICLSCWGQLADKNTLLSQKKGLSQKKSIFLGICAVLCLPLLITPLLQHTDWSNKLVLIIGLSMLILITFIAYRQPDKEAKNKLLAFAVLMIVSTVFWMLYQIGPMGLTLFINNNVQREFGSLIIPPQWFQNINTVCIIFGGPLLGFFLNRMRTKGIEVTIPTQFALALLLIGCAFALLPLSIYCANKLGMVNPLWIVFSYVLQSLGELLISPVGYAMIGSLAPASLQGVMMGMWMMNTGVGAILSSYCSNLMLADHEHATALVTNSNYSSVFAALSLFALGSAFVLFLVIPRLKSLMYKKSINTVSKNSHPLMVSRRAAT